MTKSKKFFPFLVGLTGLTVLCPCLMAQNPTAPRSGLPPVSENEPIKIPLGKSKSKKPSAPKVATLVILDTRPFFEYSVQHFEKSQPIRWNDYAQSEEAFKNCLDADFAHLVRKLRVLGVYPQAEVILLAEEVGLNKDSDHLAWMLKTFGIKKVSIERYQKFNPDEERIVSQLGKIKKTSGTDFASVEAPFWSVTKKSPLCYDKKDEP